MVTGKDPLGGEDWDLVPSRSAGHAFGTSKGQLDVQSRATGAVSWSDRLGDTDVTIIKRSCGHRQDDGHMCLERRTAGCSSRGRVC